MKENFLKKIARFYYKDNSIHNILFGPMRGMKFRVNKVTRLMPVYSGGEPWHQKRFKELLSEGDVVVDVGANWGLHTLYTSGLVGKSGKVIAVEPFPPAFEELKWHIGINGISNVVPLNIAAGDAEKEILILPKHEASQGVLSDFAKSITPGGVEYRVKQQSLDNLAKDLGINRLDLIKIDVEGAECCVLKGAVKVVDKFRPIFIIDTHSSENFIYVSGWLKDRGYNIERVAKGLPHILNFSKAWPDKNGVWGSIMAVPSK